MARPKKIIDEILVETETPNILNVMDRKSRKVIKIDTNIEKDWSTKYLHRSGVEFN